MNAFFNQENINPDVLKYLADVTTEELFTINSQVKGMTENQIIQFCQLYRAKRKDPQLILILTLLGFFGAAGIHRFVMGEIGWGILYLLTAGLCFIGTIVDLVRYKSLTMEHNSRAIVECMLLVGSK